MRAEAVGHSTGPDAGVAPGEHVGIGVADHECLLPRSLRLAHQLLDAHRVGLFLREAVAPVNEGEVARDPQPGKNGAAEIVGFVGQDGQLAVLKFLEGFGNAGIDDRVVEQVVAVVFQEKGEPLLHALTRALLAQRSPHQVRDAVADVGRNHIVRKRGQGHAHAHGVDAHRQIQLGIRQRSV